MLGDDGFKLDTERIKKVIEVAETVKQWAGQHEKEVAYFQEQLIKHMSKCFTNGVTSVKRREKVWGKYHQLRVSKEYINFWKVFLSVAGCSTAPDPAFYQHISQHIFNRLLKDTFPIPDVPSASSVSNSLTSEEANAVRYVAGYVCSNMYKKLKKSSATNSNDIAQGIEDMLEDELDGEDDDSKKWIDSIDRGGLFKVNDWAYAFFISVEGVVRQYLQLKKASELQAATRDVIVGRVMQDENVEIQWSLIGVELAENDRASLMRMLVDQWITIRGFSFAGAYIEIYKQASKKSLQKSKALRTKLSDTKKKKDKKKSQE